MCMDKFTLVILRIHIQYKKLQKETKEMLYYDLVEVKPKVNKKKVIITVSILLVIIISIIISIFYHNHNKIVTGENNTIKTK